MSAGASTGRALIGMVAIGFIVVAAGAADWVMKTRPDLNPFTHMFPKDSMNMANSLAAKLSDASDCQSFVAEILEAGKGPRGDGKTVTTITQLYNRALSAGCAKT
jgi:hypothetical protein